MALLPKATNSLSLSLYKQLAKDEGNIFFSPFSISTALSMLLCGAHGHTEQELREVLHFESVHITNCEVHSSFDHLLSELSKASDHMTLTFANAIVLQKDMSVLPEFKETVEKTYHALLLEADFSRENEKAVRKINQWVKKNTNEMIQKIVESLDPSTVMVLLNAIYFKGSWKYQFNSKMTRPRVFYNRGQSDLAKEVPMMFMHRKFKFIGKETYVVLELPYKNDAVVMLLLLPKDMDGLQDLGNLLSAEFLKDIVNSLQDCEVDVALPKFRIEYSKELSKTLIKLGMASAFDSSANFSGINSEDLFISDVITKCVLVVNEEGSEAAAATAVCMNRRARSVCNERFIADHPFLCIIYDEEKDMVLFIGRVIEF